MAKWLRRVGIALLCSLAAGFAFGTCLRVHAERPKVYIGALPGIRPQADLGLRAARPREGSLAGAERSSSG